MIDTSNPIPLLRRAFVLGLAFCGVAAAVPDVANLDLRVGDADLAPTITLQEHDNRTVEEYRVNGSLYMVKITPSVGAPYFLVDEDGTGDMAWHRGTTAVENKVPQWVLLSW